MSGVHVPCRACGTIPLEPVLSLGCTPLANSLLTAEQLTVPEETFPLDLAFCSSCSLAQITETVPPARMFSEYLYFSSFSDTVLRNAEELASRLTSTRALGESSLVMEVASNDGYLLHRYKERGVPVLGIEPAANVAEVAEAEHGIETLREFFGADLAERLRHEGRMADVIHANNVLAHVPDLNGFVHGLSILLKDDGVAVIEVPYVADLIDRCEFDTIYHEHLCYFSLSALDRLFRSNSLVIDDVEHIPIHGGSLRVFAAREQAASGSTDVPASVGALLREEAEKGLRSLEYYVGFAQRVSELRESLRRITGELRSGGARLAAYGAAAKGSTLLNYCGIGTETLDFVVDRSTHKQGLFMPGVHVPIVPPETLLDQMPDYVLLLAWNFADEIMAQQAEYVRRGGRFIVPVPEVRVTP